MGLTKEQILRYSRQLVLPEIGVQGQQQLLASSALIIGAGGLGSPVAWYLAAAGVGTIGIADADVVSLSNLHRQILHTTDAAGEPKSRSAQTRLEALNPEILITPLHERVTADNALALCSNYDVIVDGSDNFSTRYLINDACVLSGKPLIHGGVVRFGGQVLTVAPRQGACYRCVFPEPPQAGSVPNCQDAGVLGAVAGVLGTLMALEALKRLLATGQPLVNRLLVFEGLAGRFREVPVRRDPACAVCGDHPTIHELSSLEESVCTTGQEDAWRGNR